MPESHTGIRPMDHPVIKSSMPMPPGDLLICLFVICILYKKVVDSVYRRMI